MRGSLLWAVSALGVVACDFEHGAVSTNDGGADGSGSGSGTSLRLVFDNSASTTDLLDIPVLVRLDATVLPIASVGNPATDLRFRDATADLAFEIDHWNPAGTSTVWVRVPRIAAGSTTDSISMDYGPTAAGAANGPAVWPGFDLVSHLEANLANSAGATYAGAQLGVTMVDGQIGTAARFAGSGAEKIAFAGAASLFDAWTHFTLGFWIYADYASAASIAGTAGFLDKGSSLALGHLFGASITLRIDMHFSGPTDSYLDAHLAPRTWTQIVYSFDGGAVRLYQDGVQVAVTTMSGTQQLVPSSFPFFLGHNTSPFTGMLDELEISQISRSGDWIRAQHLAAVGQFITFHDP